jgi:6-pyruvoyltetrahydropterin/6-carboxytetrahydropterin synthase
MIIMTRRLNFTAAYVEAQELDRGDTADGDSRITGSNYTLEVAVRGRIDPKTGILVNIKEIDRIVREKIVHVYDGKLINRQVEAFREHPVTLETLVYNILVRLKDVLPAAVRLDSVRLASAPTQSAEWRASEMKPGTVGAGQTRAGKESGSMLMTRGYEFAASHRLHSPHLSADENRELFGKCNYEHGHGHNYELEVTVAGPIEPRSGRVLDPDVLDEIVNRQVVERYDHRHFNFDIPEFAELIPSAEVITKVIWERLAAHIPSPVRLYRVLLRETARNIFEYYGEA